MNILTLNAGSATLKYKLFAMPAEDVLASGSADHPGGTGVIKAAGTVIDSCRKKGIDAIAYRVVHGGSQFSEPMLIGAEMLSCLRSLKHLDPLHNPAEVAMIEAGMHHLPDVPAVAVFDTAFHQSMPEVAWRYAIGRGIASQFGLRRYGFHGLSHQYVSIKLLKCLGREPEGTRLVVCHLGSGASVCAVLNGLSIDSSMGLTPMEGLVMGTRSGDVDPGLLLYLLRSERMNLTTLDSYLNDQSGLLGVSGRSADVRDLEAAATSGDTNADLALELFSYRVSKYIGAYAAALEGLDAVAFTGGIGERSADVRQRICRRLGFLGLQISEEKNNQSGDGSSRKINTEKATVQAWVIAADEELQIVRNVRLLLNQVI